MAAPLWAQPPQRGQRDPHAVPCKRPAAVALGLRAGSQIHQAITPESLWWQPILGQ